MLYFNHRFQHEIISIPHLVIVGLSIILKHNVAFQKTKNIISLVLFLSTVGFSHAQNQLSSPYSRFGLGELSNNISFVCFYGWHCLCISECNSC